jgi:hypothetical protein
MRVYSFAITHKLSIWNPNNFFFRELHRRIRSFFLQLRDFVRNSRKVCSLSGYDVLERALPLFALRKRAVLADALFNRESIDSHFVARVWVEKPDYNGDDKSGQKADAK